MKFSNLVQSLIFLILTFLTSCSNSNQSESSSSDSENYSIQTPPSNESTTATVPSKTTSDAIDQMMIAFRGTTDRQELERELKKLVNYYDSFNHDYDSYLRIGNALVSLCNDAKIELTEMELLRETTKFSKGLSQNGKVSTMGLGDAMGLTAGFLEVGK